MGKILNPILSRELANLDKDAESHRLAMKSLISYIKTMDPKAISSFLDQVSETGENCFVSGEYVVPLYNVLARTHGEKISPHVDRIVSFIIETLGSSVCSFSLQQACSNVVAAIARYGISPTVPLEEKRHVIQSLCKPLSEALLDPEGTVVSGAALCLKAVVDSNNWRFASDEMVDRVCQNVAIALGNKSTSLNSSMALVVALAKHNVLTVEAYARLLIHSGLQILNAGTGQGDSPKQFWAIQMVNGLMKSLDPRSIYPELELIIEEMQKCRADQMAYVSGAANDALQTAKTVAFKKGSIFENNCVSGNGSSFGWRNSRRRYMSDGGNQSPTSLSPKSQMLDFIEYDSSFEPPTPTSRFSNNLANDHGSMNHEGIDASLLGLAQGHTIPDPFSDLSKKPEVAESRDDSAEDSSGSLLRNSTNTLLRSGTPSPQKSPFNIFSTPSKPVRFLQCHGDEDTDFLAEQGRRFYSPCFSRTNHSPPHNMNSYKKGLENYLDKEAREKQHTFADASQTESASESVASTDDAPANTGIMRVSSQMIVADETVARKIGSRKKLGKSCLRMMSLSMFFTVIAFFFSFFSRNLGEEGKYVVPT